MWLYGIKADGLVVERSIQIRLNTTLKCKNMRRNKLRNQHNADIDSNRINDFVLNGMTLLLMGPQLSIIVFLFEYSKHSDDIIQFLFETQAKVTHVFRSKIGSNF